MAICPRCSSSAVERYTNHGLSCTACGFDGATVEFAPDLRSDERKEIDASIARAAERERERCARHIELIAADWRAAGADQKVWASEYLARQIRELGDG